MLTAEDSERLCRVGPRSPMGQLMRQYWMPALLSSEVPEPDSTPLRVRLLGENLIAFRATSGRIGLIQNACPHRGASLFFGRNEQEGLRCVYHGWKFDLEGRCVDMPSEPPGSCFSRKVQARAYPCVERNGVVWAYLGSSNTPPPLPVIEPNLMNRADYSVGAALRECNWLQALEGDIDTAHIGFLHLGGVSPDDLERGSTQYQVTQHRAPHGYEVLETDVGMSYGAFRQTDELNKYWRVAHFMFPFYTILPIGRLGEQLSVRAWVPIDDENTMFWEMSAPRTLGGSFGRDRKNATTPGLTLDRETLPNSGGWLGRHRLVQNRDNDYLIDRSLQRTVSFTGIEGIFQQDAAVTESMGPIVDHSQEHLGSSDAMIIRVRRRMLRALASIQEGTPTGTPRIAPGVDLPNKYALRGGTITLPASAALWESTKELRQVR